MNNDAVGAGVDTRRERPPYEALVVSPAAAPAMQQFAALMCSAGQLRRVFVSRAEAAQWEREQQAMRSADLIWRSGR